MIYNSSLYNQSLYQNLSDNSQNISIEKIFAKCYQNTFDNIILYWKHIPFNDVLFSSDYLIETDISPEFNSQYYQLSRYNQLSDKIINVSNIGVIINLEDNITFKYARHSDKYVYIKISIDNNSLNISPSIIKYKPIQNKIFKFMNFIERFIPKTIFKPFSILTHPLGYKYYEVNSNISMVLYSILSEIDISNSYLESFNNNIWNYNDYQINDLATIFGIEKNAMGVFDFREMVISYALSVRFSPTLKCINNFVFGLYSTYPIFNKIENSELYAVSTHEQTNLYFINNDDTNLYLSDSYMFFDGIKITILRKSSLSIFDNFCKSIIKKIAPSNIYYKLEFLEV